MTSRSVWIPPGTWQDAWDSSRVDGPKTITVSQPYERIPMWHRVGGLVITTGPQDAETLRVDDQDWSALTLEAFVPEMQQQQHAKGEEGIAGLLAERVVVPHSKYDGSTDSRTITPTVVTMRRHDSNNTLVLESTMGGVTSTFAARLHLHRGQRVVSARVDGVTLGADEVRALHLNATANVAIPFGGVGSAPGARGGDVAEVTMRRRLEVQIA